MKTSSGDLWTFPAQVRTITTNGVVRQNGKLVMGGGNAKQARDRFEGLDALLGEWVTKWGNRVFYVKAHSLLTFPTKTHWGDDSSLDLIRNSAYQVTEIADKWGLESIVMPPPGCGLGGLDWEEVEEVISHILDDRFTVLNNENKRS